MYRLAKLERTPIFLIALLMLPLDAAAQSSASASDIPGAVKAAMGARFQWIEPSTPFDSCSVYESVGRPESMREILGNLVDLALDRAENFCSDVEGELPRAFIEDVAVGEELATVEVKVVRDHYIHRETYSLVPSSRGPGWIVKEVRSWGFLRIH